MAIAPGSYSFMGGAVLGKGSERQFVLVRSGSLLTAFTDDEYNACLEAVHDGKAVCVQYKIGPVTFQTQLLNVTGLGNLQFVDTTVQYVTHYRVAGTSPHTVSIVKTGSAQQFVLERDDMSTAFTASEYIQCQSRVSEGSAVCVQWKSGSDRMQAQLSAMLADGAMLFSFTSVDLEMIFIVSGSDPHNITAHTNSPGGGGGTEYTAGDAIDLTNDTISVKYGKGLTVNSSNELEVKAGNGLTYNSDNNAIEVNKDEINNYIDKSLFVLNTDAITDWIDITNEFVFLNGFRAYYQYTTILQFKPMYSPSSNLLKFFGEMRINRTSPVTTGPTWALMIKYVGNRFYTNNNAPTLDTRPTLYPFAPVGNMLTTPVTDDTGTSQTGFARIGWLGSNNSEYDREGIGMQIMFADNPVYGTMLTNLIYKVTPIIH